MSHSEPPGPVPAGLPRRLAAALYDALLVIALMLIAAAAVFALRGGVSPPTNASWYSVYLATVPLIFFVGFWTHGGQTLGMRAWRIRLVSDNACGVSVRAASIRFGVAVLSWAALGAGFLWQLIDRDHRSWHDIASRTRLVRIPRSA